MNCELCGRVMGWYNAFFVLAKTGKHAATQWLMVCSGCHSDLKSSNSLDECTTCYPKHGNIHGN